MRLLYEKLFFYQDILAKLDIYKCNYASPIYAKSFQHQNTVSKYSLYLIKLFYGIIFGFPRYFCQSQHLRAHHISASVLNLRRTKDNFTFS